MRKPKCLFPALDARPDFVCTGAYGARTQFARSATIAADVICGALSGRLDAAADVHNFPSAD
jgi:hypothetical protein